MCGLVVVVRRYFCFSLPQGVFLILSMWTVCPCLISGSVPTLNLHKIFNKSIMTRFIMGERAPMKVGERAPTEVKMFEVEIVIPNTE